MNYKKTIASIILTVGSVLVTNAQTEGVSIKSTVGPPDASAMLDVQSLNKGVLIPRVNLMSLSDNSTVPNPALSLLVYCLGTATGGLPAGYYYNSSATTTPAWIKVSGSGDDLWTLATNKTDIYRNTGVVMIGITDLSIYTNTWGSKLWVDEGNITMVGTNMYTGPTAVVYSDNGTHPFYMGLRARGSKSSPNYCQSGDVLGCFAGRSYKGSTIDHCDGSDIYMRATELESAGGHGSNITFQTTANGSASSIERMVIDQSGDIGMGINPPQAQLHIKRNSGVSILLDNQSSSPGDANLFQLSSVGGDSRIYSNAGIDLFTNSNNSTPNSTGFVVYANVRYAQGDPLFNVTTDGHVYAANGVLIGSDSTLKKNIVSLNESSIQKIKQLRPVYYQLKTDPTGAKQTGFIAQEVETVLPELVTTRSFDIENSSGTTVSTKQLLSLNYIGIIPHLVKAVQEQEALIEQLQQQNTALTARIQALENK